MPARHATQAVWAVAGPLLRALLPASPPPARYFYTPLASEARRPINVVGLGRSARSVIFGTAAFAVHDPGDNPALEGPASYVGNVLNVADEARTFLAHHLRDNDSVDRAEFREIFGGDMGEVIPTALAGWEREGAAHLDKDALNFVSQDRRARIRSLLWLVPEEAIEFDLAHFKQLDLSPSGVAQLVAQIQPGTVLGAGHTFEGADSSRVLIRTPAGETFRLRVAPGLTDKDPLRLVFEDAPQNGDDTALRYAVNQLRSVLTARYRRQARSSARP
jgi:hypothetical protein